MQTRAHRIRADGSGPPVERLALALLIVALVYATADHGAFFRTGFRIVVLLVLVAALVSLVGLPASVKDLSAPFLAASGLGLWYLVAAVVAGNVSAGAPAVELLIALAAVLVIVRRAGERERRVLLGCVLAVGTVTALSGWVGVVWRTTPLALPDTCCGGVWRAASTITYANAAAAVLSACVLVALSILATTARARLVLLVVYVLLVGLLTTLSRGGFIGLLFGLAVLAALDGRRVFVRAWPAAVGAVIATSTLLPSVRIADNTHVALAGAGLVAGAVVTVVSPRGIAVLMIAFALAVAVVPGFRHPLTDGWHTVEHGRFTTTSPDRTQAVRAALRLARDHPIAGVGPGQVDLSWHATELGVPLQEHLRYAHNEYVQVLAESGGVGFVILTGGIVATGVALWRRRRRTDAVAGAGCIAAVVAIAVHSASDYLWHIPVIPLIGAVLVAVVLPGRETDTPS